LAFLKTTSTIAYNQPIEDKLLSPIGGAGIANGDFHSIDRIAGAVENAKIVKGP